MARLPRNREVKVKNEQEVAALPNGHGYEGGVSHVQIAVGSTLADAERLMIRATLELCNGNKTRAAAMLGVSLKTLYNRINESRAEAGQTGLDY